MKNSLIQPYINGGNVSKLKERLSKESPELYEALERSWTIAWNGWLPALGVKFDSYNSYPHLKNLEYYLDEVVLGFEGIADNSKPFITPTEIYVILCGILFHDIGHIKTANKEKNDAEGKGKTHAEHSKDFVKEEWNELGIISIELARSIAKICAYHDCYAGDWDEQSEQLNNVVIDPFGEVRERWLGSLLVLIDHMDGAYTRVLPQYIRSGESLKVIGAFRNVIRGVYVDPSRQMVRTLIGDDFLINNNVIHTKSKTKDPEYIYKYNEERNNKFLEETKTMFFNVPKNKLENEMVIQKFDQLFKTKKKVLPDIEIINCQFVKDLGKTPLSISDWLVLKQVLYVELKNGNEEWSRNKLLAMVLGDVTENNRALKKISESLSENGVFIKAWLIDNKEGLYNCQGCLTFEPIFSRDYLIRVAESMWKLCTTIMNPGFFSYETLASDLRDPNIARVISAVHRICIIIGKGNSIWAGVSNWKWGNPEKKDSESEKSKKCIPLTKCEVIESIKNLDVPTIE
jgi:hypothetical protein